MPVKISNNKNNVLSRSGFTLLEVVAILIILGTLAAVAVSRYRDTGADDIATANTLKAHLRYAQLRAMGDIVAWGIEIDADSYTLKKADENGNFDDAPVNLPGENDKTKTLDKSTISNTGMVSFSPARGIPDPNGYSITIGSQTITITPETGFIP